MRVLIVFFILISVFSYVNGEENEAKGFLGMENTVGYITDSNGNKFIIIETEDGAKLVKVKENPKDMLGNKFGISKEDLKEIKIK